MYNMYVDVVVKKITCQILCDYDSWCILFQEWALGLLHTKCACGIIWLSNFRIKDTLDHIYNSGIRDLNLKEILLNLVWPVLSVLSLILLIPYLFFVGILYHILGKTFITVLTT